MVDCQKVALGQRDHPIWILGIGDRVGQLTDSQWKDGFGIQVQVSQFAGRQAYQTVQRAWGEFDLINAEVVAAGSIGHQRWLPDQCNARLHDRGRITAASNPFRIARVKSESHCRTRPIGFGWHRIARIEPEADYLMATNKMPQCRTGFPKQEKRFHFTMVAPSPTTGQR